MQNMHSPLCWCIPAWARWSESGFQMKCRTWDYIQVCTLGFRMHFKLVDFLRPGIETPCCKLLVRVNHRRDKLIIKTTWSCLSANQPRTPRQAARIYLIQLSSAKWGCMYMTNMQNMDSELLCILILGFAYYFAYSAYEFAYIWNNMQKNSSLSIFCIFFILQYEKYAYYANRCAKECK